MERASQSPHTGQFLVGMRRLASMNEGENLDAPLETERTRCRLETHIVKVPEQRVHRRRPIPSAPTHSFATPLHRTQTAAEAHSRSMAVDYSAEWPKGHPEHWPSRESLLERNDSACPPPATKEHKHARAKQHCAREYAAIY